MALPRTFGVDFHLAFPDGVVATDEVSPAPDFSVEVPKGAERPQARDEETGLLIWQLQIMDLQQGVNKNEKTQTVKILSETKPELPGGFNEFNMCPVELIGLEVSPYGSVGGMKGNPKAFLNWSFRCRGLKKPTARRGGNNGSSKSAAGEGVSA